MSWRYTAERWPFCGQMKTGLLDDIEYGQIMAPSPEAGGISRDPSALTVSADLTIHDMGRERAIKFAFLCKSLS